MKTATKAKPAKTKPSKTAKSSSARTRTPESKPLVFESAPIPKEDIDLEVAAIAPSDDNRELTHADVEGELAESVRQWGVLTRPWVYPIPEKDPRRKKGITHELIAGERRWLAAQVVGLQTIPVTVFQCTEMQADELRIIENLQRTNLKALEEARSFARLVEKHGYQVHDPKHPERSLTHKLSKSESYIYGRIKLAQLPKLTTEALEAGKISPSVALRIARIPDLKLQVRCTTEVLEGASWQPGPMTDKQAAAHIADHYMTQLKGAPFDTKDVNLLPVEMKDGQRVAGGACTDCPFRTGAQTEMFDGDGNANGKGKSRGDVCINPACYERKKDAAWQRSAEAARSAGKIVISDKDAEGIFYPYGSADALPHNSRYVFPSDKCPEDPEGRSYQELLSAEGKVPLEVAPHVVRSTRTGRVHELLVRAEVKNALTAKGFDFYERKAEDKKSLDVQQLVRDRNRAIEEVNREWRLAHVIDAFTASPVSLPLADSYIARAFGSSVFGYDDKPRERLAVTMKRWTPVRGGAAIELLLPYVLARMDDQARHAFLLELALRHIHDSAGSSGQQESAVAALAASMGLNLDRELEKRDGNAAARRQANDFVTILTDFDTLQQIRGARCPERVLAKRPVLSFEYQGLKYVNMSVGHGTKDCWEMVPVSAYDGKTHRYGEFNDHGNEGLIVTQKGIEYVLRGPRLYFTQRKGQCRRCGCTEFQLASGPLRPLDALTCSWSDHEQILCSDCGSKPL